MTPIVNDLRYPIGRFAGPPAVTQDLRASSIDVLAGLPNDLRTALVGLDDEQLDAPYREGGWTVRQLIHHVADSHMHAVLRVRLALTEEAPTIKPYDEGATAHLYDARTAPVEWSLELLESLHARWVMLLQSLGPAQWQRSFAHPERGLMTVEQATLLYAWHSRHHTAHVAGLRARMRW